MRLTLTMKPIAALAFIFALTTSVSFSQTAPPKPPAATSEEAKVLSEVMGFMLGQTVVENARMKAVADRAEAGKVFDFASAKTKADIATRRKILEEFMATSKSAEVFLDGMEKTLRAQLATARGSNAAKEEMVAGFMKGMNKKLPLKKAIHSADRTCAATAGEIYALLDAEWGSWKADGKGVITFKKKPALDKFNAGLKTIREALAKQDAAEKQLAAIEQKK